MEFDHPVVLAAIISAIAAIGTAGLALLGVVLKIVSGINRAVNHRKPGEDSLYQLVYKTREDVHDVRRDVGELREWQKTYGDTEIRDGRAAKRWMSDDEKWKVATNGRLDDLEREEEVDQSRLSDLETEVRRQDDAAP